MTTEDGIKDKHKKNIFQKHKDHIQKLSTTMNRQHTHNALTTQKIVAVLFKDVKTEETFSTQYQQTFFGQKSPQRKCAHTKIANLKFFGQKSP